MSFWWDQGVVSYIASPFTASHEPICLSRSSNMGVIRPSWEGATFNKIFPPQLKEQFIHFTNHKQCTVDSRLPVRSPMRSYRHYGRFFSARIRSQSKPYQRRSIMRSDRQSGLRSIFGGKMASSLSHCGQMIYFQYIVLTILFWERIFILKKKTVTYVFHTCTMRTLQTWSNNPIIMWWRWHQITYCYNDLFFKCSTLKCTIDPLVI